MQEKWTVLTKLNDKTDHADGTILRSQAQKHLWEVTDEQFSSATPSYRQAD
jgi:hypothetical protein